MLAGAAGEAVVKKDEEQTTAKWTPPKCIIVPVVLKMAEVDHQVFNESLTVLSLLKKGSARI